MSVVEIKWENRRTLYDAKWTTRIGDYGPWVEITETDVFRVQIWYLGDEQGRLIKENPKWNDGLEFDDWMSAFDHAKELVLELRKVFT